MIDLLKYEKFLNQKIVNKEQLLSSRKTLLININDHQNYLTDLEEALNVMNDVSILVQEEFKEVVEILVTQALKFIFGDNHSFEIDSEIARNQPEIRLFIVIDGERFSPRDDEFSGGQADVVSFALRVILWAIQDERTRATLVFDEPFRNLSRNHIESVSEMTRYLSDMLNLQFIIITHVAELGEIADVRYHVVKEKEISVVELIEKVRNAR